jgi:FkbM family methyltransferase
MIARLLVSFFFLWHGKLHLRGVGKILFWAARWDRRLQSFRVPIPRIGDVRLDFRDRSTFSWMGYLLRHQSPQEGQLAVIRRHLGPGSVFWDVGANVGLVSAVVFVNNPTAQIVAIEPNPSLAKNLKLLFEDHDRVLVLNRALSNTDGEALFYVPFGASFSGSLEIGSSKAREAVRVQLSRGDSLLDELPLAPPAIVKIDAEGHEPSVFAGLSRIIHQNKPIIIFEHDHLTDERINEITPEGYDKFSIDDETGELLASIDRRTSHNSVMIPKGQQPRGGYLTALDTGIKKYRGKG